MGNNFAAPSGDGMLLSPPTPFAGTGEFHFLLASEPLPARLGQVLAQALTEFRHDPREFITGLLKGDGSPRQRIRLLQTGTGVAVITYAVIVSFLVIIGLWGNSNAQATKPDITIDDGSGVVITIPVTSKVKDAHRKMAKSAPNGQGINSSGSKREPQKNSGGGGSGDHQPAPARLGPPPSLSFNQSVMLPNIDRIKIPDASLVVTPTAYGDPAALPKPKNDFGDPNGVRGSDSNGPGNGGAIGTGDGHGNGPGKGDGVGPGSDGNTGGRTMRIGGQRGSDGSDERFPSTKPVILYRERAKYTEEARQNRVTGVVVLNALFTADGQVGGIRVVRALPDGLTEEAIEALKKLRFRPATKNGSAVNMRMNIEFSFNIY